MLQTVIALVIFGVVIAGAFIALSAKKAKSTPRTGSGTPYPAPGTGSDDNGAIIPPAAE